MKLSYILAFFIIHMFALIFVPCLKKKKTWFLNLYVLFTLKEKTSLTFDLMREREK